MKITIFFLALSLSSPLFAQLFGPSNYEDCVLRGIKDAKTDSAVATLHAMCNRKFSTPKSSTNKLTLRRLSEGNLLCESELKGYLPFAVLFNRKTSEFSLNGRKGKIYSQTEDKLFAKLDDDDIGVLDLSQKTFELSNKSASVLMTCELNRNTR